MKNTEEVKENKGSKSPYPGLAVAVAVIAIIGGIVAIGSCIYFFVARAIF